MNQDDKTGGTGDGSDDTLARSLRRLGTTVVPVESQDGGDARRARLVPQLTAFADDVFARRKKRGWTLGLLAAATTFAVGVTLVLRWQSHLAVSEDTTPSASIRTTDGAVRVARGSEPGSAASAFMPLSTSDRVRTEDGRAEVSLRTGAEVELGPRTALELGAAERHELAIDERVRLTTGTIHVRVPKLGNGHLVIDTPNAAVTVHGTVFTVDVSMAESGRPAITTVSVTEGRVSVASGGREIFLGPTASWSSASSAEIPDMDVQSATPDVTGDAKGATFSERDGRDKASTLRDENELFRAALAARRDGNPARAVELVDRLLSRYPRSPLAGAARKERARATDALGSPKIP